MKAVGFHKSLPITAPDALVDLDLPKPSPGPRDILVKVAAVSVNPVDVKRRAGGDPPPGQAKVLGFDAAGVVDAVGPAVSLFRPGDAVFYAGSVERSGSNAEYHMVDERIVGRKPATLSFAEAAALPLTSITAWELLFDRFRVQPGKRADAGAILAIGGAGGVGSILIQIARRLTGLTVIATASRPETVAWCRDLGAHHVIDHTKSLPEELRRIGIPQVDYVAALTNSEQHLPAIVEVLKPQGALGMIESSKPLDLRPLMRKSASIHWEFMFTRAVFETPDMIAQHNLLNEVSSLVDAGVLRTTLTEVLGRIDAAGLKRAHALIESGKARGKVVLEGF